MFLLKRKLGESLLHLHGQPPLFNLYLGTALATGQERAVFIVTFLLCGLAVYAGSFLLMRRLGVSAVLAFALATWLAVSPAFVAYENWLFYTYRTSPAEPQHSERQIASRPFRRRIRSAPPGTHERVASAFPQTSPEFRQDSRLDFLRLLLETHSQS